LLHDNRRVAADLCYPDNDDGFACYYASFRFETCCTILDLLWEILSPYDVVSEDETTWIGISRVIDEVGPATHRHKRHT